MKIYASERNYAVLERFCFVVAVKISTISDESKRIPLAKKHVVLYETIIAAMNEKLEYISLSESLMEFINNSFSLCKNMLRTDDYNQIYNFLNDENE